MSTFKTGKIYCSSGVSKKLEKSLDFTAFLMEAVDRYRNCDWGEVNDEDGKLNDEAIKNGSRVLGIYTQPNTDNIVWVLTESDRKTTTILFPDEY